MSLPIDLLESLVSEDDISEDLRDWFGKGKKGGIGGGGWDRYNTKGDRIGKCAAPDRGATEGKPKCLSKEKAAQLRAKGGKKAIANAVKRKKAQDPVTDRPGTGNVPKFVSNRIKEELDDTAKVFTPEFEEMLHEKNVPTNPKLWSRAKAEAKKRFDVYPSAYANGWAAKWYKERGGGWRTKKNESNTPSDREWGTTSLVDIYKKDTPGEELDEFFGINFKEVGPDLVKDFKHTTPGQTEAVCRNCQESYLTDESMPSATYMCQTCEADMQQHQSSNSSSLIEASVAAKTSNGKGIVYISDAQARIEKQYHEMTTLKDLYPQIIKPSEMPKITSKTPADEVRKLVAQYLGVPAVKIEVKYLDTTVETLGEADAAFTQGKHVVLLAVPKDPTQGDGKGYWKVGSEVYRGPIANMKFDAAGAPMEKRWESSFTHFSRYFDSVYGQYYKKAPTWTPNLHEDTDSDLDIIFESIENLHETAEYQGRKVKLGKPFRTPDGPKKFSVYVKNDKGNVVKVNFGDPNMEIKRDDPDRRKNFRARHNCDNPGPRWKARYWSCQWGWGQKKLST